MRCAKSFRDTLRTLDGYDYLYLKLVSSTHVCLLQTIENSMRGSMVSLTLTIIVMIVRHYRSTGRFWVPALLAQTTLLKATALGFSCYMAYGDSASGHEFGQLFILDIVVLVLCIVLALQGVRLVS